MNDRELEAGLRAFYRAQVGEAETAPLSLRRDVAAIPTADSPRSRLLSRGRGMTLLAAAALLLVGGAFAVGSGVLRLPSIVPPVAVPSLALDATASPEETTTPTPNASTSPSPTPGLDLTWTQVPLDEQEPHVAWVGGRFVLADGKTGAVRTSTDGQNWRALHQATRPKVT